MYFFQPFRCKKSNEITKSGSICLFQKLDSPGAPKPTLGPKTPLKYPRRAEIGINASHAVQLTSFGPKKPDSNRSPQRSVPFTWNHPKYNYTNKQIQHITKCQKDPTCGLFLKRGLFRGIKNDMQMCQTRKYKDTTTQIHKYSI